MRKPTQLAKNSLAKFMVVVLATVAIFWASNLAVPQSVAAYPFWTEPIAPETPRDATGRIVCANCHLAQKPSEIEIPQALLPDTVFEALGTITDDLDLINLIPSVVLDGSIENFELNPHDNFDLLWIHPNVNNRDLTTGLTQSESTGLKNSINPRRQKIPEPTGKIALIVLSTLGIGSIILRKQKPKK